MIEPEKIRRKLKAAREANGLSGEEVANLLGKSNNSYITKIENGPTKLHLELLNALCKIYNIDIIELIEHKKDLNSDAKNAGFFEKIAYRSVRTLSFSEKSRIKKELPKLRKIMDLVKILNFQTYFEKEFHQIKTRSEAEDSGKYFANKIRENLKIGECIPQAFDQLIWNKLRIPIISMDLGEGISGLYSRDKYENPMILFSKNDPNRRSLFTISHELAHHIRNKCIIDDENIYVKDTDIEDHFANAFAQEFLVPNRLLDQTLNDLKISKDINHFQVLEIANYFSVSFKMILTILHFGKKIEKTHYENLVKSLKTNSASEGDVLNYNDPPDLLKRMSLDEILNELIIIAWRSKKISSWEAEEFSGDSFHIIKNFINA